MGLKEKALNGGSMEIKHGNTSMKFILHLGRVYTVFNFKNSLVIGETEIKVTPINFVCITLFLLST